MRTSGMTIGLNFPTTPPLFWNRILASVARLSRLDTLWVADHWQGAIPSAIYRQTFPWAATQSESPHAYLDYQVLLGALAAHAGRLRLGVGVTDPIRRHPVLLAQTMLTLAHLTKRPPILGIGAGERMNIEPYGLDFSEPVARLEEALEIIRLCFSHLRPLDFAGKYYRLDHAILDLRAPKGKTPEIWIGGQGPRMLRLIGQYADGWYAPTMATAEEYAAKLTLIREAAQEAGRDPQAITPALFQYLVVAPSEREVHEILDTKLGRLFALFHTASAEWRKVGARHPLGEDFRGIVDWMPERYDRQTLQEALASVPPALIGSALLWGTPEQVVDKLRAFGEVGVRHVGLYPLSLILSRRALIYGLWAIRTIAYRLRNAQ